MARYALTTRRSGRISGRACTSRGMIDTSSIGARTRCTHSRRHRTGPVDAARRHLQLQQRVRRLDERARAGDRRLRLEDLPQVLHQVRRRRRRHVGTTMSRSEAGVAARPHRPVHRHLRERPRRADARRSRSSTACRAGACAAARRRPARRTTPPPGAAATAAPAAASSAAAAAPSAAAAARSAAEAAGGSGGEPTTAAAGRRRRRRGRRRHPPSVRRARHHAREVRNYGVRDGERRLEGSHTFEARPLTGLLGCHRNCGEALRVEGLEKLVEQKAGAATRG